MESAEDLEIEEEIEDVDAGIDAESGEPFRFAAGHVCGRAVFIGHVTAGFRTARQYFANRESQQPIAECECGGLLTAESVLSAFELERNETAALIRELNLPEIVHPDFTRRPRHAEEPEDFGSELAAAAAEKFGKKFEALGRHVQKVPEILTESAQPETEMLTIFSL